MIKTLALTFQSSDKLQTLLRFVKTRPQAHQHIFVLNDEFLFQAKKNQLSEQIHDRPLKNVTYNSFLKMFFK